MDALRVGTVCHDGGLLGPRRSSFHTSGGLIELWVFYFFKEAFLKTCAQIRKIYLQIKMKVLVTQPCLTLCDPVDCSLPGSSVHGILQARTLGWVASHSLLQGIFPTQGLNPVPEGRFFTV